MLTLVANHKKHVVVAKIVRSKHVALMRDAGERGGRKRMGIKEGQQRADCHLQLVPNFKAFLNQGQ